MSVTVLTLFGEEALPEQPKKKAKKAPLSGKKEAASHKEAGEETDSGTGVADSHSDTVTNTEMASRTATASTSVAEDIRETQEAVRIPPGPGKDTLPAPEMQDTTPTEVTEISQEIIADIIAHQDSAGNVEVIVSEAAAEKATPKAAKGTRKKIVPKSKRPKIAATDLLAGFDAVKTYYTIGEVSELFKVNVSHIRFWTTEFKLKVRTTRKGDRLYTPENIYLLKEIYLLINEKGFTIQGAKMQLKEAKKAAATAATAPEDTGKSNEEVQVLKQYLLKMRQELENLRSQLPNT